MTDIDWTRLRHAAIDVAHRAHAPYSRLHVGAAGLVDDGRVVRGCNVESASYGLTLCAECGLVSDLHRSGGGRLVAVVCATADGALLVPCGRCRQLLVEHGAPLVLRDDGPVTAASLLPDAFGPGDLPQP